jgi:hypothetical protein
VRSALAFLFVLVAAAAGALHAEPPQGADAAALEPIRAKLVALDIEGAIASIDALLATPDVAPATRAFALDLRAQAHVAGGDLDAAERDFREILKQEPDYAPQPQLMGKRGMERFAKVAASMIGTVQLDLDPPDASVLVEGRPVVRSPSGAFKTVAGETTVRIEHKGFDSADVDLRAVAGAVTPLKVALVPNARALIVITDIPGVAVALDGVAAGATARVAESAPAELRIDDVGIGEHAIVLEKSCFATESLTEMVRVDLADRSPDRLRQVTMRPAQSRLHLQGAAYAGELRVDGEVAASLPADSVTMCPGRRMLEVVAGGRVVWSGAIEAQEADATVDLAPRPSCALIGAEWPQSWSVAASAWSLRGRADPPAGSDLTAASSWQRIALPPGTDLAVGVIPRNGVAGEDRVLLYSPALGAVEDRASPPPSSRPAWSVITAGADFVDSAAGVLVAKVAPGSPAARSGLQAGDRVLSVSGRRVARAADVRAAVAGGGKVSIDIAVGQGSKAIEVATVPAPSVQSEAGPGESSIVRAAWAAADAAAHGPEAGVALANLATMLERAGRERAAVDAWRTVRAMDSSPAGVIARADYALGAASPSDAKALLERARSEAIAAGDAMLAAAATDRLADLGVAPR